MVSVGFVDNARTFFLGFANVLPAFSDRALEETGTSVAGEDVVVFSRRKVPADFAGDVQYSTWKKIAVLGYKRSDNNSNRHKA